MQYIFIFNFNLLSCYGTEMKLLNTDADSDPWHFWPFQRAFTYFSNAIPDFTDNNLVNIIRYGEDYYAASEVNYINKIDPHTLETVGRVSSKIPTFVFNWIEMKNI